MDNVNYRNMIGTTKKQSKKLLESGIDPNTSDIHWESVSGNEYRLALSTMKDTAESIERMQDSLKTLFNVKLVPAWSLSALLNLLPNEIEVGGDKLCLNIHKYGSYWYVRYLDKNGKDIGYCEQKLIDSVYNMIEYLIEEKLL